jgi:hypothetical protein
MKVLVGPNTFGLERCLSELPGIYPEIELAFCSDREKLAESLPDADVLLGGSRRPCSRRPRSSSGSNRPVPA